MSKYYISGASWVARPVCSLFFLFFLFCFWFCFVSFVLWLQNNFFSLRKSGLKLNIIINHLVVMEVQIQKIDLSIFLAIVDLVHPWDASGSKNTVCVLEQYLCGCLG